MKVNVSWPARRALSLPIWATAVALVALPPQDAHAQDSDQELMSRYQILWSQLNSIFAREGTDCRSLTNSLERWQAQRQEAADSLFAESADLMSRLDEEQLDVLAAQREPLADAIGPASARCSSDARFRRAMRFVGRVLSLGEG